MRLFGSERLIGIMEKLGLEEGQVIEHPWVSRSIEVAQRRVEQHNFEIRKQLLEYDNVMNKQREIIYGQRHQILEGISLRERILEIAGAMLDNLITIYFPENSAGAEPDAPGLATAIKSKFGLELAADKINSLPGINLQEGLFGQICALYADKERSLGPDLMRHLEHMVFLQIIDAKWKDHLYAMDSLREGIGLRAYGQRDPLVEYKREAFGMFGQMVASIEEEAVEAVFKLQAAHPERFRGVFSSVHQELTHPEITKLEDPAGQVENEVAGSEDPAATQTVRSSHPKVGRNDPCPCGSGKKYKKCHGK
jgi:preprotein translocase subunit SecA